MELRTERLTIRPIQLADAPLYAALWSDPRVHPGVVDAGPLGPDEARARVARLVLAAGEGSELTLTVLEREPAMAVGFISLHGEGDEVAVRIAVAPRIQRRGVGSEALGAALGTLNDNQQAVARVPADATAAPAFLVGCGFVEEAPTAGERVFRWQHPRGGPCGSSSS